MNRGINSFISSFTNKSNNSFIIKSQCSYRSFATNSIKINKMSSNNEDKPFRFPFPVRPGWKGNFYKLIHRMFLSYVR